MRVYYTNEATNTAYLRGHAQGAKAFRKDEALFGYRRTSAAKAISARATALTLDCKLALIDGFIDGAELASVELGWRSAL